MLSKIKKYPYSIANYLKLLDDIDIRIKLHII